MNYTKLSIISFLLIIFSLILYKLKSKDKLELDNEKIIAAKVSDINRKIIVQGEIQPLKEVQVKSSISGILDRLYVSVGMKVKKGDKLAKVSIVSDPITMERLERQLNAIKVDHENNRLGYERNKFLLEQKAISKAEYEASEARFLATKVDLESVEREIGLQTEKKSQFDAFNMIKATTDGTILELPIKVGGSIIARNPYNDGSTIASVANLESLIFQGKVLESDIAYLKLGMELKIRIGALKEEEFDAIIIQISPKGTMVDGARKFDILAKILMPSNSESPIRAGYSATADIIVESRKNVLTLEERYIKFRNDSTLVEIMDTVSNQFRFKPVKLGVSDGINTEVIEGLNKNDKIRAD